MNTKQALSAIQVLSNLSYSDETVSRAIQFAISRIRCEALLQCEDSEIPNLTDRKLGNNKNLPCQAHLDCSNDSDTCCPF